MNRKLKYIATEKVQKLKLNRDNRRSRIRGIARDIVVYDDNWGQEPQTPSDTPNLRGLENVDDGDNSVSLILYRNWQDRVQRGASRNINCGSLRQIGKSNTLNLIIRDYRAQHWDRSIIVLVPTNDHGTVKRRQLENVLNLRALSIRNAFNSLRGLHNYGLFADEVTSEELAPILAVLPNNSEFVAGFYSRGV